MNGPISYHVPKRSQNMPGPKRGALARGEGLIAVAAEAVQRVNQKILMIDRLHVREAFEDVTEAILAILHELEARDIETRPDILTKAIADGVVAVERERERCAVIAEQIGSMAPDASVKEYVRAIANRIRKGIQ